MDMGNEFKLKESETCNKSRHSSNLSQGSAEVIVSVVARVTSKLSYSDVDKLIRSDEKPPPIPEVRGWLAHKRGCRAII